MDTWDQPSSRSISSSSPSPPEYYHCTHEILLALLSCLIGERLDFTSRSLVHPDLSHRHPDPNYFILPLSLQYIYIKARYRANTWGYAEISPTSPRKLFDDWVQANADFLLRGITLRERLEENRVLKCLVWKMIIFGTLEWQRRFWSNHLLAVLGICGIIVPISSGMNHSTLFKPFLCIAIPGYIILLWMSSFIFGAGIYG